MDSRKENSIRNSCNVGNLEATRLFIEHGADVNAKQERGVTPIVFAAVNGKTC